VEIFPTVCCNKVRQVAIISRQPKLEEERHIGVIRPNDGPNCGAASGDKAIGPCNGGGKPQLSATRQTLYKTALIDRPHQPAAYRRAHFLIAFDARISVESHRSGKDRN